MAAELYTNEYYSEALVFLSTAGIIVPLFKKLNLSPIHGFLFAGVLLGPFGLGGLQEHFPWLEPVTINNVAELSSIAELGVVLLMFMIGLELSLERLWLSKKLVFGLGSLQVVLCAAALAALAYKLGQGVLSAIVIGSALSLSSTAIIMPTLADKNRLHLASGRASFSILLFQDLAVAPLLVMVSLMGLDGGDLWANLFKSLAPGIVAVVAIVAAGRLLLRPLFRWVAATHSTELFMATCLLVILGTAYVTAANGESMALGAFIAGLLLAETEFRRQIETLIEPFKGLLLGLFFLSVGSSLDVKLLLDNLASSIGIATSIVAVKSAITYAAGRGVGLGRIVARDTALTIAGGGEFAFVLLSPSLSGHVVPLSAANAAMAAVSLSMLSIPSLIGLCARIPAKNPKEREFAVTRPVETHAEDPVVIVGYGRVGGLVGVMLERHQIPFIAIDIDIGLVGRKRQTAPVFFGDATNAELLHHCGVPSARALVITINSREAANEVARAAREHNPTLPIIARAVDPQHARKLYRLGVTDAVPKDLEPSLHLSELVLMEIGLSAGLVIASIHEQRAEYRAVLVGKTKKGQTRRGIRGELKKPPPARGESPPA
ncbi:cation:proton antiporter [Methylopila sp. M107]|uniref:cation:proton antiporter domain-containing protein n=1 Tax=Methylopila sp. M107 TaxID=1101190 RepID=UPI0003614FA4|nr:cation:proton antiporter [Methylopila sp. M107]